LPYSARNSIRGHKIDDEAASGEKTPSSTSSNGVAADAVAWEILAGRPKAIAATLFLSATLLSIWEVPYRSRRMQQCQILLAKFLSVLIFKDVIVSGLWRPISWAIHMAIPTLCKHCRGIFVLCKYRPINRKAWINENCPISRSSKFVRDLALAKKTSADFDWFVGDPFLSSLQPIAKTRFKMQWKIFSSGNSSSDAFHNSSYCLSNWAWSRQGMIGWEYS
jgi:hypothetical protein